MTLKMVLMGLLGIVIIGLVANMVHEIRKSMEEPFDFEDE